MNPVRPLTTRQRFIPLEIFLKTPQVNVSPIEFLTGFITQKFLSHQTNVVLQRFVGGLTG